MNLDKLDDLIRFYVDQYGMTIHYTYDPVFFTVKGYVLFKIKKEFTIFCAGLSPEEIAGHMHTVIYDVLAEGSRYADRGCI